ncbi:Floral homeotic protein APETALA 3 [Zea mays]
MLMC